MLLDAGEAVPPSYYLDEAWINHGSELRDLRHLPIRFPSLQRAIEFLKQET
jgi:hypothetical protein